MAYQIPEEDREMVWVQISLDQKVSSGQSTPEPDALWLDYRMLVSETLLHTKGERGREREGGRHGKKVGRERPVP